MKLTTNLKGQLAVSKTELRAIELGYLPSRPLFDCRYDLIIDDGKSIHRTQVKYANGKTKNSTGNVVVKLEYENRKKEFFTYNDTEVDALVVYIPEIDKLCFFPKPIFVGKRKLSIRIKPAKNKQEKGVILAQKYIW